MFVLSTTKVLRLVTGNCLRLVNCFFPADFPSNTQMIIHFNEFLQCGYRSSIGNVECKFPYRDSTRSIGAHTVGVTDGLCKIMLMMPLVGFVKELEISRDALDEPEDPSLLKILATFANIRCSYEHFENPSHFFLHALRTSSAVHLAVSVWLEFLLFFLKVKTN